MTIDAAGRGGALRSGVVVVAGASLGGLVAAAADAHLAYHAAGAPADPRLPLLLADAGILAPLALAVGLAAAGLCRALLSPLPGSFSELLSRTRAATAEARARRSVTVLAVGLLGFGVMVGLAHAARRGLGGDAPPRVSASVLAVLALLSASIVASGASAARALAARRTVPGLDSEIRALGVVVLVVLTAGAVGIVTGTTNGDGGFLGVLGVLGRDELDLRGVGLVAVVVVAALSAPLVLSWVGLSALLVVSLAPLGLLSYAGGPGLDDRRIALTLERGAPLGAPVLRILRRLSDHDHDGVSGRFGGGDCNDHDPRVFPGADDLPGNGIDEDCSGQDDVAVAAPAPSTAGTSGWVRAHFPEGLDLVLITIDTLRADLGFSGNPRNVSPHIDALAARSVVFEHAYSLASYTGKSMGPLLIGKYPSETSRTFDHFDRFGPEETFVQERLRRGGFRTLTAQAHWYFEPATGLGRGFDVADHSAAPRVPQMEGDRTVNGDLLTDRALALLENPENATRPFYLWIHYVDPHAAYVPHPGFDFGTKSRDLYDGEVAFVDAQVGRLLAALERSAFARRTAILLTSDHGEAFGEHGVIRHGHEVWEELVRVPLVVYVPGVPPKRIGTRRSAVDLVPTLLELAGQPMPSGEGPDFVSGHSLVSDLVEPPGSALPPRPVLVDMPEGPYNDERRAFFDGPYKLITTSGKPLGLYDLDVDPKETRDLLGDPTLREPILSRFKAYRRTLRVLPPQR